MKKGFTLVELLGVFTLMVLVLILVAPSVTNLLKSADDNQYITFQNNVYAAADAYISNYRYEYSILKEKNMYTYVEIEDIITSHYLESKTYNPKTKHEISKDLFMIFVCADDKYVYNYNLIYYSDTQEKESIISIFNDFNNITKGNSVDNNLLISKIDSIIDDESKNILMKIYNKKVGE